MGSYLSVPLVVAVAFPLIAGSIVSASTADNVLVWYKTLKKPSWNLPTPVFGPTWSFLYVFLGLASFVVWTQGGFAEQTGPLILYAVNLALNLAWMPIFFNQKNFALAQLDNLATLGTAVVLAKWFFRVKPVAGYLLWPYVAFLTFANALNYYHLKNNSDRPLEDDLYHEGGKQNPGEAGYGGSNARTGAEPPRVTGGQKGYGGSTTGGTFGQSTTGGTFGQSGPGQKGYPSGGANACLADGRRGRGRSGRPVPVRAAGPQVKPISRPSLAMRGLSLKTPTFARAM